jgi:hypothetical protein
LRQPEQLIFEGVGEGREEDERQTGRRGSSTVGVSELQSLQEMRQSVSRSVTGGVRDAATGQGRAGRQGAMAAAGAEVAVVAMRNVRMLSRVLRVCVFPCVVPLCWSG